MTVKGIDQITDSQSSSPTSSLSSENYLQTLKSRSDTWLKNIPKLRSWCAWRKVRDAGINADLKLLVDAIEGGALSDETAVKVFEVSYRNWWINSVVDYDDILREFVSAEHERLIDEFKSLDEKFMSLTKRYVRARLCGDIPQKSQVGNNNGTEWGILNRELNKKRHMPLRKLVGSLPNVITKLAPCQLMSPLSIAQYLSPETSPFDVVIFDEASQIPVWDAIGAIARGKQTIVVGDPKQLPPTNFFSRPGSDDEDDEEVEDLESILDECMGANLPTIDLRWHYRSRHESLITFSNHRYYCGRLITFPSAVTEDIAVKYHHVPDGIYEIGTGRINRKEAVAVVGAVIQWLRSPEFIENHWTIGVVTFNSQQQKLIEDLLDEERRQDPSLEPHFSEDAIEPVFVKNLENVQGDERDIIIFSVTFGPSITGKFSMNFGPMNKDGGERRLNVAITRARQALHVYGTLRGEDIDLSRTKAIGVRDFKHFLEYAEKGPRALAEAIEPPGEEYDSGFEEEVALILKKFGWKVHPQVGVSGFRIDLGIVHPDHDGRYLAGIECDGATYHSSANARDRDRLRELVLNGLGWDILRVWSTDWWVNSKGIGEKLNDRLNALLEKAREKEQRRADGIENDIEHLNVEVKDIDILELETQIPLATLHIPAIDPDTIYQITDMATLNFGPLNAVNFHEFGESNKLSQIVEYVVHIEGPISLNLLATRIARAYGMKKTGAKILKRIKTIATKNCTNHKEKNDVYFWPDSKDPVKYKGFRICPPRQAANRNADDISLLELSNSPTT